MRRPSGRQHLQRKLEYRSFASDARGSDVDFMEVGFQTIGLELVRVGAVGVGLNDVRAGANVFGVDLTHQIGRYQIQFVIGAIDVDAFEYSIVPIAPSKT